jgi:ketosteroid isomerase-like protein
VDAKQDLVEQWQRWQRSIEERDVDAAAAILDDDYALQLVQPGRAVVPRAEWLATLREYVVESYAVGESLIDIDGDLATILHRAEMTATVAGADRSGVFVVTDVWRRRDGVWRVWRRHSTPLSAGAMPRVASGDAARPTR